MTSHCQTDNHVRMGKVARDSNMELLRIVSMFLIVLHHSTVHGYRMEECFMSDLFSFAGGVGVNCFVFISGYYMVRSRISINKMLKLWLTVLTYSLGLYLLLQSCLPSELLPESARLSWCLFPFRSNHYWFVSAYMGLMLISPFLNHYLLTLKQREMLLFVSALVLLLLVLPVNAGNWSGFLLRFVMLYSLAAYVRLHGERLVALPRRTWFAWASLFIVLIVSAACVKWCSGSAPHAVLERVLVRFYAKDSIAAFALSVCLFMGFASYRIGCIRWVNLLSACTFGVYLIHEHMMVRPLLWNGVFHVSEKTDFAWETVMYCSGISVLVYMLCSFMEWLRLQTLGRLYDWLAPRAILPVLHALWGCGRVLFDKLARLC